MEGNEVDSAAVAGLEEVGEPASSHSLVGSAIRHSRGAQFGLSSEWLHVCLVAAGSLRVAKVGLGAEVGLVEAEEMRGAGCDGAACCGGPARG